LAYVQEAFRSNWMSTVGPNLNALEPAFESLIGWPSLALASGTAGLHLGFKLLGVGPGDEVITPTLTFAASCNPILYLGARPVFLDSEPASWNLDPGLLADTLRQRAERNRLPKAVSVVHLFGQAADLNPIVEVCRRYEVPLIEDAAESLGARYQGRHPGTFGEIGVFSFNGNKIITGTSGGMLVAPRREVVDQARHWSTQARDPDPEGINNYVHSELGYNYRLSNVLAGIVRGQLEVLEERVQQRRAVFERYREAFAGLPGIEPQPEADFGAPEDVRAGRTRHTRWLSCFLVDEERFGLSVAALVRELAAANVEARPVWKPMHTQPLYRDAECLGGGVAERLNRRGVCLPSSSNLTGEEQAFVIRQVRAMHERAVVARKDRVSFAETGG
jgi:pyridoxal phosphate-dependent aminotransferase EpsN